MAKHLYFVAALPQQQVSDEVWAFKRDLAEVYNSRKGLNILPHITYIAPFGYDEEQEALLIEQLGRTITPFVPETIQLNGFGRFEGRKSYTLYVAIEKTALMQEQYEQLNSYAREKLRLPAGVTKKQFTPHMTIAYRDLEEAKFNLAWPAYRGRAYTATMHMDRLWLLKHNGKHWEPLQDFEFKGFGNTLF